MRPAIIIFIIAGIIVYNLFQWRSNGGRFFGSRREIDKRFHRSKLVSVILGLDDESVNELLALYKKEFGAGAARYARRTFQKWKAGKVQPSWQTYERFLLHLPNVMSYDLKCEVLRHFMEEYAAKDDYELDVDIGNWEEKLTPLVQQIIEKPNTAQLPIEVERKLKWLGDGDMHAAQKILQASQAEEGRIAVSMLREEFVSIEKLLADEGVKPKIRHTLRFPYGTIRLNIKRR
jgi:hypothetical protein